MTYGLKQIAQDLLAGKLPATAQVQLVQERLKVCSTCENLNKIRQCNLCGCFMDMKAKLLEATCPADLW